MLKAKPPVKKRRKGRELTTDDYAQVLAEFGTDVESGFEAGGEGVVIIIRRGHKEKRPVLWTESLFYSHPKDKEFFREFSKTLQNHEEWALWDIWHH